MHTGAPAQDVDRPNPPAPRGGHATDPSLCVLAGGEALQLPSASVREVLRVPALTRMPHAPAALLGLCNLRGAALPVFSLRALTRPVDHEASPPGRQEDDRDRFGPEARVIVLDTAMARVGLLVEAVLPSGRRTGRPVAPDALLLAVPVRGGAPAPLRHDRPPARGRNEDDDTARTSLVCVRVGAQEFALRSDAVLWVGRLDAMKGAEPADHAPASSPQKVPGTDAAMLGVVTAREALLPVLDLAVLLGLTRSSAACTRMVVTTIDTHTVVLAVDALTGMLRLPIASIEPVPPLLLRGLQGEARIDGICRPERGRRLVQLLHPDRLLHEATMRRLAGLPDGAGAMHATTVDGSAPRDCGESFLLVLVGPDHYGLPLASVEEVVLHPEHLTDLPNAHPLIEGVITLRGRVLPVIDAARRFEAPAAPKHGRRHIVVVRCGATRLGLAVDRASGMMRFAPDAVSPSPAWGRTGGLVDRVAATETGDMVLLLDPAGLAGEAALAGAGQVCP